MAEMPTWTLTYHARPMSLNVERAGNRFQRAPLVKEWRGAYRWLAAEEAIPPLQWIHVEARPQYRTARSLPDTAACVGSVKAAIDGLVDAGVLPDDGPELVRRVTFHAPEVVRSLHSDRLVLVVYGPVSAVEAERARRFKSVLHSHELLPPGSNP